MMYSVRSLWTYYLREMSGAELCVHIVFLLVGREREKINFTKMCVFLHYIEKLNISFDLA